MTHVLDIKSNEGKVERDFMKKAKSCNIHTQIMSGYLRIIILILGLGVLVSGGLYVIRSDYFTVMHYQENNDDIQNVVSAHYEWLEELNISIQTGAEFTGSQDASTCSFGQWIEQVSEKDLEESNVSEALKEAQIPHEEIHSSIESILKLSENDVDKAFDQYVKEISPKTKEVIKYLNVMSEGYAAASKRASNQLERIIIEVLIAITLGTIIAVGYSFWYARSSANKIAKPVLMVTSWAKDLSLGMNDLDVTSITIDKKTPEEVKTLVDSFKQMNENIKENIKVINRVAAGDMTAFVNIRSDQDTLGKDMYHMVQTNNMVFQNILDVAQMVANGSTEISQSSFHLADIATTQASSVEKLSATINAAKESIMQTTDNTKIANGITKVITEIATQSNEKMAVLVDAVTNIAEASEQISTVIKTIDAIAYQTNILALNAAVEAASAGAAGKGFAVVADEVRNLANRSAAAVKLSEELIKDTILKSKEGKENATDVFQVFGSIIKEISAIVIIMDQLSGSSKMQLGGIEEINKEIIRISDAAQGNVAISEEASAASLEMTENAEKLQAAIRTFNLRKRKDKGAYIPPEKANDENFIKKANEAYVATKKTGNYGTGYITPE